MTEHDIHTALLVALKERGLLDSILCYRHMFEGCVSLIAAYDGRRQLSFCSESDHWSWSISRPNALHTGRLTHVGEIADYVDEFVRQCAP